ncbi:MAG: LamG domain-containing protein, partial [Kiritimatiellae bacterium]|nr:LamG domain-containing protein [Kiritimatiellia bacterium]
SVMNEYNSGQLSGGFSFPSDNFNIDYTPVDTVLDGLWHHVAIVYDPDTDGGDRVRLYFDGVQQGEGNRVSDAGTTFLSDVLYIGSRADSESNFIGELDDIKITGSALAPSEFMTERTSAWGTLISVF